MTAVACPRQCSVGLVEFSRVLCFDRIGDQGCLLVCISRVRRGYIRVKALRLIEVRIELLQLIIRQRPVARLKGVLKLGMPQLDGCHHIAETDDVGGAIRRLLIGGNDGGICDEKGRKNRA